MSKKLTEEEQLVWERLKHGLEKEKTLGDLMSETFGAELCKEIDRQIIADLYKMAKDK